MNTPMWARMVTSAICAVAVCNTGELLAEQALKRLSTQFHRALFDSSVHGTVSSALWFLTGWVALSPGVLWYERRVAASPSYDANKWRVSSAVHQALHRTLPLRVPRLIADFDLSAPFAAAPRSIAPSERLVLVLLFSAMLAFLVACALDADHFIAARSLSLRDATSLGTRPFGHAVLFVVLASSILAAANPPAAIMVAVAWGSHQLRDSTRRGLWLWPAGSTPPLPVWTYSLACTALSLSGALLLRRFATSIPPASMGAGTAPAESLTSAGSAQQAGMEPAGVV